MGDIELGVNELEAAEPVESTEVETDVDTEVSTEETDTEGTAGEESHVQSAEDNARFAAARRRAEQEFNQKQALLDAEFAKRFEGYENPITHQPICNQKDYFDALDAQEKLKTQQELESKGIDPKMFEEMVNRQVANNPLVLQSQQFVEQINNQRIENQIAEDIKAIGKMNPNIKSLDDLVKDPQYDIMIGYVSNNGMRLSDAYKLVNFDSLLAGKTASVKQQTINNLKGTSHLNATDGLSSGAEGGVDIPPSELNAWKRAFPDASMKELKAKYNRTL